MPIYEYECTSEQCTDPTTGRPSLITLILPVSECAKPQTCPKCGEIILRIISRFSFYLTPGGVGGFASPGMSGIDYSRGNTNEDGPGNAPADHLRYQSMEEVCGLPPGSSEKMVPCTKKIDWKGRAALAKAKQDAVHAAAKQSREQVFQVESKAGA